MKKEWLQQSILIYLCTIIIVEKKTGISILHVADGNSTTLGTGTAESNTTERVASNTTEAAELSNT